jgi:aspartyl protease
MTLDRARALFAFALTAACAHGPPPAIHVAKLMVLRDNGAVRPFIKATIEGHPLLLLVDTGAAQSLLPTGFVRKFKLATRASDADPRLIDINGHTASMHRVPGARVLFEGEQELERIDFLENPTDGSETEGILAPQDLVRSGWALTLDLAHDEIRYDREEIALARLGDRASLIEIDYHRCEFDNHRVVTVMVNGVASSMMIDTGASRTALGRNNEALPSMLAFKGKVGVSGGVVSNGVDFNVRDVPVEFAKASFVLTATLVAASQSCGRGLLGADVLSGCSLIWGSRSLWASCHAPPPQ